jgi:Flp pilus assembly protein TadG
VSHRRLTGDAGQGLIELALTLPLLILILLGGAEFARFAWASIETANAARAGAQYGAQTDITASDDAGMQTAALNDGVNLTGLTATSSHSCACSTAPTASLVCTAALSSCASPAIVLEYVQVNTSSTIRPLYHWPGLPATFTPNGSALMQVAQP